MTSGRDTTANSTGGGGGGGRVNRISFRPRPIDIAKPMPIIRDVIEDGDAGTMSCLPTASTGMELQEEEEFHLQEIIKSWKHERVRQSDENLPEIPIPVVKVVDDYDRETVAPFQLGSTYILYHDIPDEELDQTTEYDLDSDDEELVNSINTQHKKAQGTSGGSSKKPLLNLDRFETIMDKFEKELAYYGSCDQAKAELICKGIKSNYVTMIYQHWLNKRKSWKNSMIRRLIKPPDREDPSPYKAFRPREETTNKQKKARKNDQTSLQKMQQLRQEFERARTLLEMIKKREKLKKDQLVVYQQMYDQLIELAKVRSKEEDLPMPVQPISTSTIQKEQSSSALKKKKESLSSSTSATPSLTSSYLANHTYPGPAFVSAGQQILSNGKARQEGYRHYVPQPGQFPTPSIDKQYGSLAAASAASGTPASASASSPLSKPVGTDSTLSPMSLDGTGSGRGESPVKATSSVGGTQALKSDQEEKEREAISSYFNSISIPTSSNYYHDEDEAFNDSDDSDSEQQAQQNQDASASFLYDPNILPQPKLNSEGTPIYPSFNQGYIFISPNVPPLLGKFRVGRYGGTYIDFLPFKQTQFPFYQNQLELFYQKVKEQQQEQQKLLEIEKQKHQQQQQQQQQLHQQQQEQQPPLPTLPQTSGFLSPSSSLPSSQNNSPTLFNNSCNIYIDPNTNLNNNSNNSQDIDVKMEDLNNNNNSSNNNNSNINNSIQNGSTNIIPQATSSLHLKRKLSLSPPASSGNSDSPNKKILITDYDGFTPIPHSTTIPTNESLNNNENIENINNNDEINTNGINTTTTTTLNHTPITTTSTSTTTTTNINTTPTSTPTTSFSPISKSLKYSKNKNRQSILSSTASSSPTIEHYFTKKLSPTI